MDSVTGRVAIERPSDVRAVGDEAAGDGRFPLRIDSVPFECRFTGEDEQIPRRESP